MRRDENEAYLLVIKDNSLRVFDLTGFGTGAIGTEVNVYNGNGIANTDLLSAGNVDYINFDSGVLAGLTFASTDIAATTIADFTYSKQTVPIKVNSSTTTLTRPYEAMIYVKGADYGMILLMCITIVVVQQVQIMIVSLEHLMNYLMVL